MRDRVFLVSAKLIETTVRRGKAEDNDDDDVDDVEQEEVKGEKEEA